MASSLPSSKARYTVIGWAVARFGWPMVRRMARRRAATAVRGAGGAARMHPMRVGLAAAAAVGAAGWLVARARDRSEGGSVLPSGSGNGSIRGTVHQASRRRGVGSAHQRA